MSDRVARALLQVALQRDLKQILQQQLGARSSRVEARSSRSDAWSKFVNRARSQNFGAVSSSR